MQPSFLNYVRHGWRLIPLDLGDKRVRQRGWNREELALSEPADVEGVQSAGLAHAYSGTCAIDIDDVIASQKYMLNFDINLRELYTAPDAVRILSGRKNRAKLIYSLPEPLQSVKVIEEINGIKTNIIDFRCGTADGHTTQDALPPSIHPLTKKPYYWSYGDDLIGDWQNPPPLPECIKAYWLSQIHERNTIKEKSGVEYSSEELAGLLKGLDPDVDYNQWLKIGMAVHDASAGSREGIEVWDEWSATGSKYQGKKDLVPHWRSFRSSGITVDYLLMHQIAEPSVFDDVTDQPEVVVEAGEVEGKKKKAERFQITRVGEWVNRPPPKWIVRDLLPQADLAMLFGQSGSGKSFFAMDVAMSIATGRRWRDKDTISGSVLWVAAEAAGSIRSRSLGLSRHNNVNLKEADFWIMDDTPDLANVDHVRSIAKRALTVKPVIIIIDTLAAASGGANENSGQDMAVILAACRVLGKITGALIWIIHHSGKDQSKGARGWSGMKAAMQTEIEVVQAPTGERIARIVKQRDGEQDLEFPFRLVPINLADHDGVPQSTVAVEAIDGVFIEEDSYVEPDWINCSLTEALTGATDNNELSRGVEARALETELEDDDSIEILSECLSATGRFKESGNTIKILSVRKSVDEEF